MKKITVTNANDATDTGDNADQNLLKFEIEGPDSMEASDGYHTFSELYDHRITLYIALCRILARDAGYNGIWRSKLHSDGTKFEGWFVLGIGWEVGKQITYHLPLARWPETEFALDLHNAPDFDGHTPADVLERLKNL